jgi:hypothetical protein
MSSHWPTAAASVCWTWCMRPGAWASRRRWSSASRTCSATASPSSTRCSAKAIKEEGYAGSYRGVFPIKVNQLREVVDEIVAAGKDFNYGLEAGSKPELMIALAMHEGAQRLIICNGYKDHDYIRLALLGRKLGKKIIIVVEQLAELDDIIRISAETGVKPMIGFRAKLQTRGEGKWAMSTGDNAKFGLNTAEILFAVRKAPRRQALSPASSSSTSTSARRSRISSRSRTPSSRPRGSTASSRRWVSPWATSTSAAASASTTTARARTSSPR